MTKRIRKISLKVLAIVFSAWCAIALAMCFAPNNFKQAIADDESVEIMNDHFSVSIDANGYRADFITDQIIWLNYDKDFHGTAAWLNDKTDGIADGLDLGNYLVINGKTFNEIKAAEKAAADAGEYPSVDNRVPMMQKGGVWTPIAVCAETNRIKLEVNRGYADIGAMTIGLKDGFTYTYNGVTYKVQGDLTFKATITADDVANPVFKKVEEITETEAQYVNKRNIEADSVHAVYTGFRTFPLLNADNALNTSKYISGRTLADNYMYMKEYIKVNGKNINYWNISKYDDSLDYTNNPVGNTGRAYSVPIVAQILNNGEYKIWIHTAWAEKVGIDLNNFTIEFAEDMPFVDTNGNVCRTAGAYKAIRTDGVWTVNELSSSGASVRLLQKVEGQTDRSAIRFNFKTASAFMDGYLNADGTFKNGVSSGVLLIPQNLLGSDALDIANTNDKIEKVTLSASDWRASGNVKSVTITLYGLPESEYTRDICARAYVTDGNTVIYSAVITRNMEQIATSYLLDDKVTDAAKKTVAEQYVTTKDIVNLADYSESGKAYVKAGKIVKDGAKYALTTEDMLYTYNASTRLWNGVPFEDTLSDEEFITIADFPPHLKENQGYTGTAESRLQDYADLGFTTVLLTEDDYPILDKAKDSEGNYTDEYVLGELNGTYKWVIEKLIASGLNVWVRNYNNQADYFSSKELTTQFQEYGAITGFYMSDEPFTTNDLAEEWGQDGVAMDQYGALITWKNTYYPDDFWHINLVPSSSYNHWENGSEGKDGGYGDYIQYYIDNVLKKLTSGGRTVCLDCYPLRENNSNGIYRDYLFDLLTAANKTRDYNATAEEEQKATFGMCVQTFAFYGGNVKTEQRNITSAEEITFQLYTGMAMGAGMFEYFAYSSDYTETNGAGKGYDCITKVDGTKTDLYGYVKTANERAFGFSSYINAYDWQGALISRGARFADSAASGKRSDLYLISKDGTKLLSECDKYSMGSGLVVPSIWKNFEKHKVEKDDAIRCVDWTFDYQSSRTFFKNRLWICGVDHLEPREDLPEIVSSLNEIYNDAEFKLSTIDAYFDAIAKETTQEKPLDAIGEQRGNYDKHYELSNTLSSRPDIKLLNREAENLMFGVFESLDIFPKPSKKFDFLDRRAIAEHAYKELLKSHAHDSICTCGSEETCADEKERLRGVKEVALELIKDDLSKIGSSLKRKTCGGEILVFNPLPYDRSEILEGYVSVPFNIGGDKLTDENGNVIDESFVKVLFKKRIDIETIKYTEFAEIAADETRTYLPQNAGEEDIQTGVYYRFRATVKGLSFARYGFADGRNANEKCGESESLKNDCLINVEISEQGDIAVSRNGGVECEFYPVIDIDDGDSYTYANIEGKPCAKADEVFIETADDNGLFTEKKVKYKFNDAGINKKTVELCLNLQFSKNDDSIKVSADIVNLDCYGFRLGLVQRIDGQAEYVSADTPFDLTKRPIAAKKDLSKDIFTCSMRNVLNVRLNNGSASVMSKSFQEYEAWRDEKHTFIRYTLLRSSAQVYNTFLPTKDESGAGKGMRWKSESLKMLGRNTFEFAFKLYDTPKTDTEILNDALKYQFPPIVKGIAPDGNKDLSDYEGLSIDGVVFSSIFERVKGDKKTLFARVYNPCDNAVVATARYKGASKKFAVERGKIYEMNLTTEFGIDGL